MAPGRDGEARPSCAQRRGDRPSSLTLGELPNQREARADAGARKELRADSDVPRLGLTLAPAGEVAGSGSEGVVVTDVDPDGVAAEHGFKTGDVILEVARQAASATPADVRKAIARRAAATASAPC